LTAEVLQQTPLLLVPAACFFTLNQHKLNNFTVLLPPQLLPVLVRVLLQALDKAFDMQADVCKAMRDVDFDQQLLNKVRHRHLYV
jgi:hypothetical protein